MDWLIITLISRALWAGSNIVDKLLVGKYIKDFYVLTLFAGITPFVISLAIIFVRKMSWLGLAPTVLIILVGAIQIIAVLAFYKALSKEEVSRVIPLFQLTPLIVLVLSIIFLQELLNFKQSLGFILILLGGILISLKRAEGLFKLREVFWWMLLSSSIYAIQAVILKHAYSNYSFLDVTVYLGIGEFLPTSLLLFFSKNSRDRFIKVFKNLKTGWLLLILETLFVAGAYLSGFWAFKTGSISLISVLRGFQSVFILVFALAFSLWFPKILKEELRGTVLTIKVTAISLMLIGVYFVA